MPRFRFSLQAVLRQRELAEESRQRDLAVLLARRAELEAELRRLDETVQSATADLRDNRLTGPIDLAFLAGHRRFMLATQRSAQTVIQRIALMERNLAEARRLLAEAAKARKVVEKLRERQLDAWKQNLLKKEQEEIDEVGQKLTLQQWAEDDLQQADEGLQRAEEGTGDGADDGFAHDTDVRAVRSAT